MAPDLIERHRAALEDWQAELDFAAVHAWDLDEMWELTLDRGHTITFATRRFVGQWVDRVRREVPLATDDDARELVRTREMKLKGARSKFHAALLESWSGESGLGPLEYRWPVVQNLLNDLYRGLNRG